MAEWGFELIESQPGSHLLSVLLLPWTHCVTMEKWPQLSGPQFSSVNWGSKPSGCGSPCALSPFTPAPALTSVSGSLYNNFICDVGAESLAHVLPDMVSLQVLE